MRFFFPKRDRLLHRAAFAAVERRGERWSGHVLHCRFCRKDEGSLRLGITVSRRFGKAVERNRSKRLIREAFRHLSPRYRYGCDVVITPRLAIKKATQQEVMKDLVAFFETNNPI